MGGVAVLVIGVWQAEWLRVGGRMRYGGFVGAELAGLWGCYGGAAEVLRMACGVGGNGWGVYR